MPSQLEIINDALDLLGEPDTTSLDSEKKWVKRLVNRYERVRDNLFEDHPWNEAEKLVLLSSPSASTDLQWPYSHALPVDFYRLTHVSEYADRHDEGIDYDNRGNAIHCIYESIYVWYISSDVANSPGSWPQKFADLLAAELADRVYPNTDESDSTRDRIERTLKRRRRDAKVFNGNAKRIHRRREHSFQRARRSTHFSHHDRPGRYSIAETGTGGVYINIQGLNLNALNNVQDVNCDTFTTNVSALSCSGSEVSTSYLAGLDFASLTNVTALTDCDNNLSCPTTDACATGLTNLPNIAST